MSVEREHTNHASPPKKNRWAGFVWRSALLLIVLAALLAFYLSRNPGMQQFVLPTVSRVSGLPVSAESASLGLDGVWVAQRVRVKFPAEHGKVGATLKLASVKLCREDGKWVLTADGTEFLLPAWPDSSTRRSFQDVLDRVPNGTATFTNVEADLPPVTLLRTLVPRLTSPNITLMKNDHGVGLTGGGRVDLKRAPGAWVLVDGAKWTANLDLDAGSRKPVLRGTLSVSNGFSSAPARELEQLELKIGGDVRLGGVGKVNLRLLGRGEELLQMSGTLNQNADGGQVGVRLWGEPQVMNLTGQEGRVRLEKWESLFGITWNHAKRAFDWHGSFDFPGLTVSLSDQEDDFLPAISLQGKWHAKREGRAYAWDVGGKLSQGKEVLLKISSAAATGKGARPVVVELPRMRISRLHSYLAPFGIALPEGTIEGRLNMTPIPGSRMQRVKLNLQVSDLTGYKHMSRAFASARLQVDSEVEPWQSAAVSEFNLTGSIVDAKRRPLGGFKVFLLKEAITPVRLLDWRRRLTEINAGIEGQIAVNESQDTDDDGEGTAVNIAGKLNMELGSEPKFWLDLRGTHGRRAIFRTSMNAFLDDHWLLKHVEVGLFNVDGLTRPLARAVIGPQAPGIERLRLSGILSRDTKQIDTYRFTSSMRAQGIDEGKWLPNWMRASNSVQLNGVIDSDSFQLTNCNISCELAHAEHLDDSATVQLGLGEPFIIRSVKAGFLFPEKANVTVRARMQTHMLRYLQNLPVRKEDPNLPLVFNSKLLISKKATLYHAMVEANASLDGDRILRLDAKTDLAPSGKVLSAELAAMEVHCPLSLQRFMDPRLPNWKQMQAKGRFRDGSFSMDAGLLGVGRLSFVPSWANLNGSLSLAGKIEDAALDLTKCSFLLTGFAPKRDKAKISLRGELKKPAHFSWLNRELDLSKVDSGLRLHVLASPDFISQLVGNPKQQDGLGLAFDFAVKASQKELSSTLFGSGTVGSQKVLDLKVSARHDLDLALRQAKVDSLSVVYHQGMLSLLLPNAQLPQWNRANFEMTLAQAGGALDLDLRGDVLGLRHKRILGESLTADMLCKMQGRIDPERIHIELSKMSLGCQLASTTDKQKGNLDVRAESPLRLNLVQAIQFNQLKPGSLEIGGNLPLNWFARMVPGAKRDLSTAVVQLSGHASINPASKDTIAAGLKLSGKIASKQAFVCQGTLSLDQHYQVQKSDLKLGISWHKEIAPLIASANLPFWKSASLDLRSRRENDGMHRLAIDAMLRQSRHWPGLPEQFVADGHLVGEAALNRKTGVLRFSRLSLDWTSKEDKESRLSLALKKPLPLRIDDWLAARKGLDSAIVVNGIMANGLFPGLPAEHRGLKLHANLAVTERQGAVRVHAAGSLADKTLTIGQFEADIDLDGEGRVSALDLQKVELKRPAYLSSLSPTLGKLKWDVASGKGKIARTRAGGYDVTLDAEAKNWDYKAVLPRHLTANSSIRLVGHVGTNGKTVLKSLVAKHNLRLSSDSSEILAVTTTLSQPSTYEPLEQGRRLAAVFRIDGHVSKLLGLRKPAAKQGTKVKLEGELRLKEGAKGIVNELKLVGDDAKRFVVQVVTSVDKEGTISVAMDKLSVKHYPDFAELLGMPAWRDTEVSLKMSRKRDEEEWAWAANVTSKGVRGFRGQPTWAVFDVVAEADGGISGKGFRMADLKAKVLARNLKGVLLADLSAVLQGSSSGRLPVIELPDCQFNLSGAMRPALWGQTGASPVGLKPVDFAGQFIANRKARTGNLTWRRGGKDIARLSAYLGAGRKAGNLDVELLADDPKLFRGLIAERNVPRFRRVRGKIDLKAAGEQSLSQEMLASVQLSARDMRDRGMLFEKGDLVLSTQLRCAKKHGWAWSKANPFAVKWNDEELAKGHWTAQRQEGRDMLRLTGTSSLPTSFQVLSRFTLPDKHRCTGGHAQFTFAFSKEKGEETLSAALGIKEALFIHSGSKKKLTDPFNCNLRLGIRHSGTSSAYALSWRGESKKDKVEGRLELADGVVARVEVVGEAPDFTPLWQVFATPRSWADTCEALAARQSSRPGLSTMPRLTAAALSPSKPFRSITSSGKIAVKRVSLGPIRMDEVRLNYNLSQGVLELKDCGMELNGASVAVTGSVEPAGQLLKATLRAEVLKLPLEPIGEFFWQKESDEICSKATVILRAQSNAAGLAGLVRNATGKLTASLTDTCFYSVPLLADLAGELKLDDLEKLQFEEVAADLSLSDGRLNINSIRLQRDESVVDLEGFVRIDGWTELNAKLSLNTKQIDKHQLASAIGLPLAREKKGFRTVSLPCTFVRSDKGFWYLRPGSRDEFQKLSRTVWGRSLVKRLK